MTTQTGEIHGSVEKDQSSEVGLLDFQKDDNEETTDLLVARKQLTR